MHVFRGLIGLCLLAFAGAVVAADQCPLLRASQSDQAVSTRIAAAACDQHVRWQRPFIGIDGLLASSMVAEGESLGLEGGGAPWRQVAMYWRDAGLLERTSAAGANDCMYASANAASSGLACRGFVIDKPWSAAFISWVMRRAGVPGFRHSSAHYDYVRAARTDPAGSPYMFMDPAVASLATGDMLCYVRTNRVYRHQGLASAIDGGAEGLNMHCDIVVAANPAGDAKVYLVGGNVQQAVTMRVFNLNSGGRIWGLPQRTEGDVECSPDTAVACNFNRQDWAAVLKLKPQAELAKLGSVDPPSLLPNGDATPRQACCVSCVVGSGIPRCPAPGAAQRQPWVVPPANE